MIVFFDTSALLKRYVAEPDSDAIAGLWKNAATIAASHIWKRRSRRRVRSPKTRAAGHR